MKINQRKIRIRICNLMNWTEGQFANHLIESLSDYTARWSEGDKEFRSLLMNSPMYVRWYVSNYYKRCKIHLNCHPKSRPGEIAKRRYMMLHNCDSINIYPNKGILQEVIKQSELETQTQ